MPVTRRLLLAALTMLAGLPASSAQTYPERPISLIVQAPAGGPTDVAGRILAGIAEKLVGQPIVVVNKVGAGGQVGWTELSRSKPDGYTIGFIAPPTTNTVILNPERQAIFDEKSFLPIINHVVDPGVVWIRAGAPYRTFADLIAAAKQAPGTIRASTTGILSDDHLAILMTEEATGAKFRIVHLDGAANQLKETLGGNVDVSFDNVGSVVKPMRAGQVRALAVTDHERSKFMPDVPTTKELGFPTIVSSSTRGLAAPQGTPQAVIDRLGEVFAKAMEDPDHVKRMEDQGLAVRPMRAKEFTALWLDQHTRARKYVEWARSRPQ